jgi:hypothetical protein
VTGTSFHTGSSDVDPTCAQGVSPNPAEALGGVTKRSFTKLFSGLSEVLRLECCSEWRYASAIDAKITAVTVLLAPRVRLEIDRVCEGGLACFDKVSNADACRLKSAFNS